MDKKDKSNSGWSRRDILKGLSGVPFLGSVWWAGASLSNEIQEEKRNILQSLNIEAKAPPSSGPMSGDPVRLGIIGFGIRGKQLCRAIGFATNDWIQSMNEAADANKNDSRLQNFLDQENLNIKLTAVCDLFDVRAEEAIDSFGTDTNTINRYRTYQELLDSGQVDAIIIATPDHWHATIAIAALQ